MSTEKQTQHTSGPPVEMLLLVLCVLLAWPALLLGMVARVLMKRWIPNPSPYWWLAGGLGLAGAVLMWTQTHPDLLLLTLADDIGSLLLHWSMKEATHALMDAFPLWLRSLAAFPLVTALFEAFRHQPLEEKLLTQEREGSALETRRSKNAARRVLKAPEHIKSVAVLGALIEDPNR